MAEGGEERQVLGDLFDRTIRALDGLPDVVKTQARPVRAKSKVFELTQTYIVQTYRQRDEGDYIFIEYIGKDGSLRLALPPAVSDLIARQYDALSGQSRRKAAKALAAERKAQGIVPGFLKRKATSRP